jgi:YedE family putative selenium metabolism protein
MLVRDRHAWSVILAGALLGLGGVFLAVWGNPQNSGICVSCFIENSAGALGLHGNTRMQYLRPELIGFVLGAAASAAAFREFGSRGGSAPLPRFIAGAFLIVGCAVFIGCPIKLVLRLTAGDLTAVAGFVGLGTGVWIGLRCLGAGVHLGGARSESGGSGLWVPAAFLLLLGLAFWRPLFLAASSTGSGAEHAPLLASLGVGLGLGVLAQRSRFCITGSLRDMLLMGRRAPLGWGLAAFFAVAFLANLGTGRFHAGYFGQPGAHLDALWSLVGMLLVGWISVLIGGCPFRQLIRAGEGDADAGLAVLGMFAGGALVQSWGLAATAAGVPLYGKIAVLAGMVFVLVSSLLFRERAG